MLLLQKVQARTWQNRLRQAVAEANAKRNAEIDAEIESMFKKEISDFLACGIMVNKTWK